jgi:hypothetical protein
LQSTRAAGGTLGAGRQCFVKPLGLEWFRAEQFACERPSSASGFCFEPLARRVAPFPAAVDPRYSVEDAERCQTTMIKRNVVMRALQRLKPGAHVVCADRHVEVRKSPLPRDYDLQAACGPLAPAFVAWPRAESIFEPQSVEGDPRWAGRPRLGEAPPRWGWSQLAARRARRPLSAARRRARSWGAAPGALSSRASTVGRCKRKRLRNASISSALVSLSIRNVITDDRQLLLALCD